MEMFDGMRRSLAWERFIRVPLGHEFTVINGKAEVFMHDLHLEIPAFPGFGCPLKLQKIYGFPRPRGYGVPFLLCFRNSFLN